MSDAAKIELIGEGAKVGEIDFKIATLLALLKDAYVCEHAGTDHACQRIDDALIEDCEDVE